MTKPIELAEVQTPLIRHAVAAGRAFKTTTEVAG